ncbi:MAG: ABC transporter permease [Acidimicrobiales bacterium]
MTTGVALAPEGAPTADVPRPEGSGLGTEIVIARRTFRQVWIGATMWAVIFGISVASTAVNYATTFSTVAQRQQLAATTSSDRGLAILLGPITSVDTVGGYTTYKIFVFLTTIGALWGLLLATRLLRGEEDVGRWQMMLAGSTRPGKATVAILTALWGAVAVVGIATVACTALVGRDPDVGFGIGSSIAYGLSIALVPAVFVAVGAVTSQLGRTRRVATGLGMAVFGVTFVLRMIADSGSGTRWLLWTTPFGWTELMRPLTENDLWPLLPAAATTAVLGVSAVVLASRRDAGDGVLASRDVAPPRPFGLRSSFGLAARLELPVLVGWCIGAVAAALMLGIIAKLTTATVPESLGDALDKFGVKGTFTDQYFGIAFLFVVTVVALIPASQVAAAFDEEASGRLAQVITRPVSRPQWFAGRLLLTAGAIVVASLAAGVAAWVGAASQGVDVGLRSMVGAAANGIPTALVTLGIGAVVLALVPRFASAVVYGVVIWSLVAELFGSLFSGIGVLQRVSLFHYLAVVPAEDAHLTTLVVTAAVGVGLCVLATVLFDRRDLRAA